MVYTVTLNPAVDYTVGVENYQEGMVNRTSYENITAGGKGINVSVILTRLGTETSALGFCGGFTGKMLLRMLDDMEVNNDFIYVPEGSTRINIKLKTDSRETEINGRGCSIDSESLERLYHRLDDIKKGDFLVLAGSIPKSLPPDIYVSIAGKVKNHGVNTIIDASGELLLKSLELNPFLVKPNNFELGEIFGTEINTREQAVIYAEKLQKMGALNVLVSLAGKGAVLVCSSGEVFSSPAPSGEVKSSVGAGDSMVAGFIYGYIKSENFSEAFRYGISAGSATAFSDSLADREKIMDIFSSLNPDCKLL